jgi:AAA+ ATPase superfamily predicted ATPase
MDNGATTKESMLDYVVRQDSYFLTEGKNMLNDEFSSDYSIYFSIMQLIANGKTRVSEIDGEILRPTSVYLANLEKNYELIAKIQPILARPNSRTTKYLINDNFLRFWFRFILPYQSLIEQQQFALLRQHIDESYTQFSGITLEQIFKKIMFESGKFTNIGNWWDNKSNNEIDIVAINEFNHTGVIAEVKRNTKKIDLSVLEEKTKALPTEFNKYKFEIIGLSLEDLCNKK